MLPEIWGESAWDFIHFVTLGYPENPTDDDKERYYQYFHALKYVLPCGKCRNNMSQHLKKNPLSDEVLSSRQSLVKWGIDLHNIVNYYTGKTMLSYTEAMTEINNKINKKSTKNNFWYYSFLLIAIIIIVYMIYFCFIKNK